METIEIIAEVDEEMLGYIISYLSHSLVPPIYEKFAGYRIHSMSITPDNKILCVYEVEHDKH
jgi:hypothetical protein